MKNESEWNKLADISNDFQAILMPVKTYDNAKGITERKPFSISATACKELESA